MKTLPNKLFNSDKLYVVINNEHFVESKFVSVAMIESHLQDDFSRFLVEVLYWLGNVLVLLTTQLYRPQAVKDGITSIVEYCLRERPNTHIDVVLMFIEHVVLVHIFLSEAVEHNALLSLFNIFRHLSKDVENCYDRSNLEDSQAIEDNSKLQISNRSQVLIDKDIKAKEQQDLYQTSDLFIQRYRFQVEGHDKSTFCALIHLFEAIAHRQMHSSRARERYFLNEIYVEILKNVNDVDTRNSCLKVSRTLRDYCQENFLFFESIIFEPCENIERCIELDQISRREFILFDVTIEIDLNVNFQSQRILEEGEDFHLNEALSF